MALLKGAALETCCLLDEISKSQQGIRGPQWPSQLFPGPRAKVAEDIIQVVLHLHGVDSEAPWATPITFLLQLLSRVSWSWSGSPGAELQQEQRAVYIAWEGLQAAGLVLL